MSDPFMTNRYPRLTLKGYRFYKGTSYPMTATISLLGDVCTVQRQLRDSVNRFQAMRLEEMSWHVKEQDVEALRAVFAPEQSPLDLRDKTLLGYPLRVARTEFRIYGKLPG